MKDWDQIRSASPGVVRGSAPAQPGPDSAKTKIDNLLKRFEPLGATREVVAEILTRNGDHAGKAAKALRSWYQHK
jgi:hypothetical protein